jgi:hypothetical protein
MASKDKTAAEQADLSSVWAGPDRNFKIARRVALDWGAGIIAAFTASPIIMAVDKAVVEGTSGSKGVFQSFFGTLKHAVRNPLVFLRSREFLWIFAVYGSTYMAANSIDSVCKITQTNDVIPKLIGVTAVNMTASILKDRAFAYYFGKKVTNRVGLISYAFWLLRDVMTMAAAFVIPSRASKYMQENHGMEKSAADKVSLVSFPMIFQLFLSPIHMLGYDFYNFKDRAFKERVDFLKPKYISTVGIRMLRMGAAYGIGGVNNRSLRDKFVTHFEGKDWDRSYPKSNIPRA